MTAHPSYKTRKTCRLCGSDHLKRVLSLGNLCASNFVDGPSSKNISAPLELVRCTNPRCGLLQLKHTVPQELLYRTYWYQSGISPVIKRDLAEIVARAQKYGHLKKGDVVLDIGANDGTLLSYYPKTLKRVACEPVKNLQPLLRKHADRIINNFWNYKDYEKLGLQKPKVITAIAMLYDLEDPNKFVGDIARALDDKGVFIAQLMTLKPMIEKNDIGNVCHEHLEYYSYPTLVHLFEKNGLEIFRVEENDINGGSYRLFSRKYRKGSIAFREPRFDYDAFAKRIKAGRIRATDFIKKAVKSGRKVHVYGASTKGNTILQYYGLDYKTIGAAAERSSAKWGKFTVKTMIPIISEEQARKENPHYFFVLPWAFLDAFIERESDWLSRGGKFILSIPEFRIIGKEDLPLSQS